MMSTERTGDEALEVIGAMARGLCQTAGVQATMQGVVDGAEQILVNCHSASLMRVHRRRIHTTAASSPLARAGDQAQYATGQGPCLDALAKHEIVVLNDPEHDGCWPAYQQQALLLGIHSQVAFRLFMVEETMGALNLYSRDVDAFDDRSMLIGYAFATHAAIAIRAALTESGLRTAIASRDVIGQAKGLLMAHFQLPESMALEVLRECSQHSNRRLRELAEEIASTGDVTRLSDGTRTARDQAGP